MLAYHMVDEPDCRQVLDMALADHDAGRVAQAEAGYRSVLARDPDDPDALNLLGVLLQERGALDESIALLDRALAVEPDFPEALANLARARRLSGDAKAAANLARRAITLDPDLAEAHLNLGQALLVLGNEPGAMVALRQAVTLAPKDPQTLLLLGGLLLRLHDTGAAAEALQAALARDGGNVDAMLHLAAALVEDGRFDAARPWYEKAASCVPENPRILAALGDTRRHDRDLPAALEAYRRAVALAPNAAALRIGLGSCLTVLGDFAGAEDCFRQAMALDPQSVAAQTELARIGRETGDTDALHRLQAELADSLAPTRTRIAAGIAIGTQLDRQGDYDTAFAAFAAANRLIRADLIEDGERFDGAGLCRMVDWAISTFTPGLFDTVAGCGDPSDLPVFIVGMPRSGTTLVEQILASHLQVFGAGERKDVGRIIQDLNGGGPHRSPETWDRDATRQAAAAQVALLRDLGGDALRVTDKLPDNSLHLGQIAMLFPRARVIVCRRDLRDVCLSCYFQHFKAPMVWTTDQAELALRARQIDRLLAHWRAVLPLPVLEVQYERLVADLETESRRLVAFLGLDWDPACLDFHRTERPVLTASVWQVRQPVYGSSVGRWRHYQRHLGPLLEGLGDAVPADG